MLGYTGWLGESDYQGIDPLQVSMAATCVRHRRDFCLVQFKLAPFGGETKVRGGRSGQKASRAALSYSRENPLQRSSWSQVWINQLRLLDSVLVLWRKLS